MGDKQQLAEEILEKLDEMIYVNWNFKKFYIKKIVEALDCHESKSKDKEK